MSPQPPHPLRTSADTLIRGVLAVTMDAERRILKDAAIAIRKVVEDYRCTTIDEAKLYADVDQAADGVIARSGLPFKCAWPVV